jgi:hypothetical protein
MENEKDYIGDIKEIRNIMERTTRFISLSGFSGILSGLYALAGAWLAYRMVYTIDENTGFRKLIPDDSHLTQLLAVIAIAVLVLALATGIWLSYVKSVKQKLVFWGPGSRQFLIALITPLVTGGLLIIIMALNGNYALIAPSFLIFYGLALIAGARFTISDVQWLGYLEIAAGLFCALIPGYGLIFLSLGFGILHILYGIIMIVKYGL